MLQHALRRIGANDMGERGRKVARDSAVAAAKIYTKVLGAVVVLEDCVVKSRWV